MGFKRNFVIENGDLVIDIGGYFPTRPVHAYIPMYYTPVGMPKPIGESPVAYLDQKRAKRVCDAYRKRMKRKNAVFTGTTILGITVK